MTNILLTRSDFENSKWEEIISNCKEKEYHIYSESLFKKAREAEESGDKKSQEVYSLLGYITSMYLKPESPTEPFGPFFVTPDSRSAMVNDFNENHLEVLSEIVLDIKDPEMRSRVADVLWIRMREIRFAQLAIESYLGSATNLEHPRHWTNCADRIERAFRLSRLIGVNTGYLDKAIQHIDAVLDRYKGSDPLFLSEKLMGFLIEVSRGDFEKYSKLSQKIARGAEKKGDFDRARAYWEMSAKWHKLNNDTQNERAVLIQAAETYVKEAEATINRDFPSCLVAAFHQQSAIEAYRRIGGEKKRIEELHHILLQYQQKSRSEMIAISTERDLGDLVRNSIDRVKGKPLKDALFELAIRVRPPRVTELREQVLEAAKKYPLQHLVSSIAVNEMGKVIARQSGMFSSDENEVEVSIRENMLKQAEFHRSIYAKSLIEPIRQRIMLEHNVRITDFFDLVSNNPFVPKGREYLYAQGLQAGMEGDFVVAAHLLIPQIENSIRHILSQMGVITSGIDSKGIQDERSLNITLYTPEIKDILGEDIVFDLQGLLVERFGANLRNRVAHGLMSHESFYSVQVPYLWALIVRLCCLSSIKQKFEREKEADNLSSDNENKAHSA